MPTNGEHALALGICQDNEKAREESWREVGRGEIVNVLICRASHIHTLYSFHALILITTLGGTWHFPLVIGEKNICQINDLSSGRTG